MTTALAEETLHTFSITAPGATSVLLAGDFTDWRNRAIPMRPRRQGLWQATVPLPPGSHRYRFIVDGEARDGLECVI